MDPRNPTPSALHAGKSQVFKAADEELAALRAENNALRAADGWRSLGEDAAKTLEAEEARCAEAFEGVSVVPTHYFPGVSLLFKVVLGVFVVDMVFPERSTLRTRSRELSKDTGAQYAVM